MRQTLAIGAVSALIWGGAIVVAPAQSAPSKATAKSKSSESRSSESKSSESKHSESRSEAKAEAKSTSAEPTLIGQFGTWGAYMASPNGKKVCFALAKPSSSKTIPANRPRDPAYAFVSTRPSEKVVNEVSIMIGYAVKPGSESTLQVGGATYAMYTRGDGLWIKNAAEEARMVEAMRKSADVVVKATSTRGTETVDTFSTKGLSQALDRVAKDCRR